MTPREANLSLIDDDQGVCPDGHPCFLTNVEDVPQRTCGTSQDHGWGFPMPYFGWPIIRDGIDREDVRRAYDAGADIGLVGWAGNTIGEREALDDKGTNPTETGWSS